MSSPLNTTASAPDLTAAGAQGNLAVRSVADLFREEGAAIPVSDAPVLALRPGRPSKPRMLVPASSGTAPRFEGGEHTYLGNEVTLQFDGQSGPATQFPLTLANGLKLIYGQIVALGGDFYGIPEAPISDAADPEAGFLAAFNTLSQNAAAVQEAPKLLSIMQIEIDAVNRAIAHHQPPSTAYTALGLTLSAQWNVATGGGTTIDGHLVYDWLPKGRYLKLADTNWDHFGAHAVTCYTAGHQQAMKQAVAAAGVTDPTQRTGQLQLAYAMNAFADHFLTDLFSSGHMRTPRKELSDTVTPSSIGSLLALFMHDEDCYFGLQVKSVSDPGGWTAYGDKRLLDPENAANLAQVLAAIRLSAAEVWTAYSTKAVPASGVPVLIPDLGAVSVPTNAANPSPLFIATQSGTQRRTNPADRFDYSWTDDWWGTTTYAKLSWLGEFRMLYDSEISMTLDTDIVQLWNSDGRLGLIQYGVTADGQFATKFASSDMDEGSGAVKWLAVDMDGDGRTEIVQLYDNGGSLGAIVYAPNADGIGYAEVSKTTDMGEGPNAVKWLAVDMDGDGRTEIVQLYDNGGSLGMIVYSPNTTGTAYVKTWNNSEMGEGSRAVQWLAIDIDGNGRTEIVQLYDNGNLGAIVYSPTADGSGYARTGKNTDLGEGPSAEAFLAVDMHGDGKTQIVQAFDNGNLGLIVYSPSTGGSYAQTWKSPDMGQGPGAVQWLAIDQNGDGRTEIAQLWSNDGSLGMIIYSPTADGKGYEQTYYNRNLGQTAGAVKWLTNHGGPNLNTDIVQLTWQPLVNRILGITVYSPLGPGYIVSGHTDDLHQGAIGLAFFAANTTGSTSGESDAADQTEATP
jgi:hypothetical protein